MYRYSKRTKLSPSSLFQRLCSSCPLQACWWFDPHLQLVVYETLVQVEHLLRRIHWWAAGRYWGSSETEDYLFCDYLHEKIITDLCDVIVTLRTANQHKWSNKHISDQINLVTFMSREKSASFIITHSFFPQMLPLWISVAHIVHLLRLFQVLRFSSLHLEV